MMGKIDVPHLSQLMDALLKLFNCRFPCEGLRSNGCDLTSRASRLSFELLSQLQRATVANLTLKN